MKAKQFGLSRRSLLKFAGATAVATAATAAYGSASASAAAAPTAKLFYTEAGTGMNVMLLHG
jgi:anaerobic selenocysteine-containing dehydrogenase